MIHSSHPIILASGSFIRKKMLENISIPFEVIKGDVDETGLRGQMQGKELPEQAIALAKAKATAVSKDRPDAFVIGSDQICALDGMILSKPNTVENAEIQLTTLSGKTHQQHSAVALYHNGTCVFSIADTAELTMRTLSASEIAAYIALDKPLQSCGAYHFEEHGRHLFSSITGNYDTILGMPLQPLLAWLHQKNIIHLSRG